MSEEFVFTGVSTQSTNQSINQPKHVECFIDLQDRKSKHLLETLMEINQSTNQSINLSIVPMVSPDNRQSFYLLKAAIISGLYQKNQPINQSTDQSKSTNQSINQSVNETDTESANQSIDEADQKDDEKLSTVTKWTPERINQSINQSVNQSSVIDFLCFFYPQSDRFNSSTHYVNKTEEDLINHCCRLLIDFFNVDEDEFDCFYGLVKSYENHLSTSPVNQSINESINQSINPARKIDEMALSVCRYAMKRGIYQSPTLMVDGKSINQSIDESINQSINQSNNPDALKQAIQQHLEA